MGNPVVHFEVMGSNVKALREFYTKAFGWELSETSAGAEVDYRLVDTKVDAGIKGGIGQCPDGYSGHVTFYVGVPDINAALTDVERLGGKRMMGPDQVPNGPIIALFNDPEERTIGLVQIP